MKALLDAEVAKALLDASAKTGQEKEKLLEGCLTAHLLERLGRPGLTAFLRRNNPIQIQSDAVLN